MSLLFSKRILFHQVGIFWTETETDVAVKLKDKNCNLFANTAALPSAAMSATEEGHPSSHCIISYSAFPALEKS